MNTRKLVAMFAVALVVARSVVLMRKDEYRLFPIWYFLFMLGSLTLVKGVRRYMEGDWTLWPGGRAGQAWYQDLGLGIAFATIAIVCCVVYVEQSTPNKPPQHNAGSRTSSTDSPTSETPPSLGPRG